jgi:hypothetical protein
VALDGGDIFHLVVQYLVVAGGTQYGANCSVSQLLGNYMGTHTEALMSAFTLGTGSAAGTGP